MAILTLGIKIIALMFVFSNLPKMVSEIIRGGNGQAVRFEGGFIVAIALSIFITLQWLL